MNALLLAVALVASSTPSVKPVVKAPSVKVWTCGDFQPLANDRVQMVRTCEFK